MDWFGQYAQGVKERTVHSRYGRQYLSLYVWERLPGQWTYQWVIMLNTFAAIRFGTEHGEGKLVSAETAKERGCWSMQQKLAEYAILPGGEDTYMVQQFFAEQQAFSLIDLVCLQLLK